MKKWVYEDYTEDAESSTFFVVPEDHHGTVAETWNEDNARLIAAAPDMLEALELVIQSKMFHALHHYTRKRVELSISKAKGESK